MGLFIKLGAPQAFWRVVEKTEGDYSSLTCYNFLLNISDILAAFGAFLAVLIAIARKIIVFDFKTLNHQYVYATAAVVVGLGIAYWLVSNSENEKSK